MVICLENNEALLITRSFCQSNVVLRNIERGHDVVEEHIAPARYYY